MPEIFGKPFGSIFGNVTRNQPGFSNPVIEFVATMTNYFQGGNSFNAGAPDGPPLVTDGDCELALPTMNGVPLTMFACAVALSTDHAVSGSKSIKVTGNTTSTSMNIRFVGGAACGLTAGKNYKNPLKVYIPSGQGVTGVKLRYRNNAETFVTIDEIDGSITDTWIALQGDFVDDDFSPDFASGGIAGMLGE